MNQKQRPIKLASRVTTMQSSYEGGASWLLLKQFSLSSPWLTFTFKERQNVGLHLGLLAKCQACYCHLDVYFFAPICYKSQGAWTGVMNRKYSYIDSCNDGMKVCTVNWFRWADSYPKTVFRLQVSKKRKRIEGRN